MYLQFCLVPKSCNLEIEKVHLLSIFENISKEIVMKFEMSNNLKNETMLVVNTLNNAPLNRFISQVY